MPFNVVLRDLTTRPCTMLVEVAMRDSESIDEDVTNLESEALKEFVLRVQALPSIPNNVDVFISWYTDQGDIVLPREFIVLVYALSLKVTICLND